MLFTPTRIHFLFKFRFIPIQNTYLLTNDHAEQFKEDYEDFFTSTFYSMNTYVRTTNFPNFGAIRCYYVSHRQIILFDFQNTDGLTDILRFISKRGRIMRLGTDGLTDTFKTHIKTKNNHEPSNE